MTAEIEDINVCTMLLPTNTATKVSSNRSVRRTMIFAVNLPLSASILKWYLSQLEKAFSEAEKRPETNSKTAIRTMAPHRGIPYTVI